MPINNDPVVSPSCWERAEGTFQPFTCWHRRLCLSPQPLCLSARLVITCRPQVNCVPVYWMTASVTAPVAGPLPSSLFLGAGGWGAGCPCWVGLQPHRQTFFFFWLLHHIGGDFPLEKRRSVASEIIYLHTFLSSVGAD